MEVLPSVNQKEVGNSILRVSGDNSDIEKWNALPPLTKTETFIKPNPEANVLMNYTFGNNSMNEPLIISRTLGNKRGIFILGYGLHKWKLQGYAQELAKGKDVVDLYAQLMDNSVRWLSIDNNFDSFVLRTNKRTYTEGEEVECGQVGNDGASGLRHCAVMSAMPRGLQAECEVAGHALLVHTLNAILGANQVVLASDDPVGVAVLVARATGAPADSLALGHAREAEQLAADRRDGFIDDAEDADQVTGDCQKQRADRQRNTQAHEERHARRLPGTLRFAST